MIDIYLKRAFHWPYPKAKLEVFQGVDGEWYFRKVSANGNTLTVSECYKNLNDALRLADYEPRKYKLTILRG